MRRVFLSHFVLSLACAGGAFFAWHARVPQTVYAADASMLTSAIAALFVVTVAWLGWQAWDAEHESSADSGAPLGPRGGAGSLPASRISADFGHLAERLAVALGLVGTVIGLYLQAKAAPGEVNFTALVTTGCGAVAYVLIAILTFNVESGIKRARG